MEFPINGFNSNERGIRFRIASPPLMELAKQHFSNYLQELQIDSFVELVEEGTPGENLVGFQVRDEQTERLAPEGDTSQLCRILGLDTVSSPRDLEREIVLAMLLCPIPFEFPSFDELRSSIHIRHNIVEAARKTSLSFATNEAERPAEYWDYDEDRGFILKPGKSIIDAIRSATQPGDSGKRYTFSCRRAGEYVVQLAVAQEIRECNPSLFDSLERQAITRALKGREFEGIFQRQIGSPASPLPVKFFIPGDRTWFRNPEPLSADITGYEGSWTFYLGNGIFADFWRPKLSYNLVTKCLSIFHWRNSTYRDVNGDLQIDESRVEAQVDQSLNDPSETKQILDQMLALQAPLGVYEGGCVEPHREYVRQVCPETSDLHLPDVPQTSPNHKVVS